MVVQKDHISGLLSDLKEEETIAAVAKGLARGEDPLLIMDQCQEGIIEVGHRYENGEYYTSALVMAGEIMRQIAEILLPVLKKNISGKLTGRILLATVHRDIHFIGKNIFKVLLQCTGYIVHDLGEDVPPEKILAEAKAFSPDIIGLSCLLSSCYEPMRETVSMLKQSAQDFETVPRIIIGGRVNEKVNEFVGADGWADDAMIGLRLCNRLIQKPSLRS